MDVVAGDAAREGGEGMLVAVGDLVAEVRSQCSGSAREALDVVRERLAEPLRVAVVGRVSSGKSTLVNALLETRVAATGAAETTAVPHWYRYGRWSTVTVVTATGSIPVTVPPGGSSIALPVPVAEVERIEVVAPLPMLRDLVLIDTPGMSSAERESGATVAAAADADAVLLVINGSLTADEAVSVAEFRARSARDPLAAGTAVAVLTKADQLGPGADALGRARAVSAALLAEHAQMFAAVVPVVGLLGETGTTGGLDEHDAQALTRLAAEWDPTTAAVALSDHRLFAELPSAVPAERRRRLLTLLGLFGVGALLDRVREGDVAGAGPLCDHARRLAGIAELQETLAGVVLRRGVVLRASTAVQALTDAATSPGATSWLADRVQALTDSDVLFPVRILAAAAWVASGQVSPPPHLAAQVAAAAAGRLGAVSRAEAAQQVAMWRSWRMFADGPGQHTADIMVRAWQLAATGGHHAAV